MGGWEGGLRLAGKDCIHAIIEISLSKIPHKKLRREKILVILLLNENKSIIIL